MSSVLDIVQNTRAIRYWIDGRIAAGWTDEQIDQVLPIAVLFITGRTTMGDLLSVKAQIEARS